MAMQEWQQVSLEEMQRICKQQAVRIAQLEMSLNQLKWEGCWCDKSDSIYHQNICLPVIEILDKKKGE